MSAGAAPRVSVGLPVYNGERYLREALDGVLGQSYADLELVVSDNASTDGTEAICREYAARDARLRYHRQPRNMGAVCNFNRAFELARGEYFMWAAFDDRRNPEYLARCVPVLETRPEVVLCCTDVLPIDEDGAPLGDPEWPGGIRPVGATPGDRAAAVARASFWYDFYGLMRAEVLRKVMPLRAVWGFDVVLTLDMCLRGEVAAIAEPLFEYRVFRRKTQEDLAQTLAPESQGGILVNNIELAVALVERCLAAPLSPLERVRAARRVYREFCLRNPIVRPILERELATPRPPVHRSPARRAAMAALRARLRAGQRARGVSARLRG
ncbi:MAG TPA: glycosyltransferase [Longimicrobium sp.]|uniref:glycosyltransferase family 2 protein n=1 Tax=Longimicrobium sp. TaxID=2029185 RepID=UPI002EDB7F0E